jgi:uncharacterized repeat protein (TIGR04138 family)
MQEVSFEEALEIITLKDPRYPREAYSFVREALDHTQRTLVRDKEGGIRHVSGQELLAGIRDYATAQFGPMATTVFEAWGIHACQDFGELVFNMVETGGCPTLCSDDIVDMDSFVRRLQERTDSPSAFLWENLAEATRLKLAADPAGQDTREVLTKNLNQLITRGPIYAEERFSGVSLPSDTKRLLAQPLHGVPLAQLNRMLLELAYPAEIAKSHGLLAKTKNDTRADFEDGYDFYEAFRKPFLPPSKQAAPAADAAPSRP